MPSFNRWYDANSILPLSAAARAILAYRRIMDRSSSIVLRREVADLSAQTVRIEYSSSASESQGETGEAGQRGVVVFGVKDHPTVTDTDIARGDRFSIGNAVYEVTDVNEVPGEIQATARRISP